MTNDELLEALLTLERAGWQSATSFGSGPLWARDEITDARLVSVGANTAAPVYIGANTATVPSALSRYHRLAAQILIRQLDDDTKTKLHRLAKQHGRSTEEEVREILRNAVRNVDDPPGRLGSRIASRFRLVGLQGEIPELRGQSAQPAQLEHDPARYECAFGVDA